MTIYLDPFWVTLFLSGCIFFVSYKLGRAVTETDQESIIAGTIDKLIEDGYIAIRKTSDGDIELIPYKEINHVD